MTERAKTVLLTEAEAAEFLRVRPKRMRNWRCEGVGPNFVKIGHFVRYKLSDLEAYIDEHTHVSSVREFMEDKGVA